MIGKYFFLLLLSINKLNNEKLDSIHYFLSYSLFAYTRMPPEADSGDKCYHYTELLMVKFNKKSKVSELRFSDSAPDWLIKDFEKTKLLGRVKVDKLDSIAKKNNIRNIVILFPVIIEPDSFPCGESKRARMLPANYFCFNNQLLNESVIIGKQIEIIWPSAYHKKN